MFRAIFYKEYRHESNPIIYPLYTSYTFDRLSRFRNIMKCLAVCVEDCMSGQPPISLLCY